MGGIVDALSNLGKDAVDNISQRFGKEEVSQMWSRFRPMMNEFQKTEPGKDLLELNKQYIQNYGKALQSHLDQASQLPKDLQPHPLQLQHQSRNIARELTYGKNDALGVALIHQAGKAAQAQGMDSAAAELHQQNLADFTASLLHDLETRKEWRNFSEEDKKNFILKNADKVQNEADWFKLMQKKGQQVDTGIPFSSFKMNVQKNKEFGVPNVKAYPTYAPVSRVEHQFNQYANTIIYPTVVLPHLGTVANDLISTPLKSLAKTAAEIIKDTDGDTEFAKIQDFTHKAGILSSTAYDIYSANYYGSRGLISKYMGDRAGQIFYKSTHNPLFDAARNWQLSITASAGYHTLQQMTEKLLANPTDKRAIFELTQMGINPAHILAQKGQLTDEQIQKAMFRFTDNKVFLDTALNRSYYARTHPMLRLALMYHSYVSREARLIAGSLKNMVKVGDLGMAAQTIAALGVAFPLVGLMTKNITTLARGDFNDVHPKQDVEDLTFQNGGKAFLDQYLEDYSHTAAFGIAAGYLRGAGRYSMNNVMIGPLGNIASRGLYDSLHPFYNAYEGKYEKEGESFDEATGRQFKPLLRDLVEYNPAAVDNLGKIATHIFLPIKKEEEARHPKPSFKFKSKVKRPHFKKFQ